MDERRLWIEPEARLVFVGAVSTLWEFLRPGFNLTVTNDTTREAAMFSMIRDSVRAVLLPAGLALLCMAGPVQAQTRRCQGTTSGQTGTAQTSQLRSALLQAQLQQQISQLQTVLQQLQSGQITFPAR